MKLSKLADQYSNRKDITLSMFFYHNALYGITEVVVNDYVKATNLETGDIVNLPLVNTEVLPFQDVVMQFRGNVNGEPRVYEMDFSSDPPSMKHVRD